MYRNYATRIRILNYAAWSASVKYTFKMNILKQIRQVERIFNKTFYGDSFINREKIYSER